MSIAGRAAVAQRKRRKRLEEQIEKQNQELDLWFVTYDQSKTGMFEREEMGKLMTAMKRDVLKDESVEVKPDMLDKIMAAYGTQGPQGLAVSRSEAGRAIRKYRGYLKHEKTLREWFSVADSDGSGDLPPDQLKQLLQKVAEAKRAEFGHLIEVTDDDVSYIMEVADESKSGTITYDEAGLAVGSWIEAAKTKPRKSEVCAVL